MKITLTEWAAKNYTPPPSAWVLAEWRRAGQIHPLPERVGREWYVDADARRVIHEAPRRSLVRRISEAA